MESGDDNGDDLPGGLDTPGAYASFALRCRERGYPAFKLYTWQPPIPGAPDPKRDIEACAAVRDAVGPGVPLMLDPYHYYSRQDALVLGQELEKLDYYWLEEPMDEHSMSSYVWLCDNLSLPICGPETAAGKLYVRAEWVKSGAADIPSSITNSPHPGSTSSSTPWMPQAVCMFHRTPGSVWTSTLTTFATTCLKPIDELRRGHCRIHQNLHTL